MKVLFLLFLVFIIYSHSIDIQPLQKSNYLSTLRASRDDDYFYFSIDKYLSKSFVYLYLFENDYGINKIYYCQTNTFPSQSAIDSCSFFFINHDNINSDTSYNYKIPILSNDSYIIIRYSGSNNNGTFKASFSDTFKKKILVDVNYDTELTAVQNDYNYFYAYIGNLSSNRLYFYFKDKSKILVEAIFYHFTNSNPESFIPTTYYYTYRTEKYTNNDYDYLYIFNISSYRTNYIYVRYTTYYSGSLFIKIRTSKILSTVAIVFIVIGPVIFVGIMIALIVYCCKKKSKRNLAYAPTQPAVVVSPPNAPLIN